MRSFFTTLAFCAGIGVCVAQSSSTKSITPKSTIEQTTFRKNSIRVNLSSLILNNYSFSYERSVSRKMSLVGSYSFLPSSRVGDMALAQKIANKYLDENNDLRNKLDEATLASQAVTGEVRLYTGKHDGPRGFYVGAYGRYTTMQFDYLDSYSPALGDDIPLPYKGKFNGLGGGLMVGAQWLITDRITLDWYIAGAHYGKTSGDVNVTQDFSRLSESEKRDLETEVEERFTFADKKLVDATITNEGGHGKVDAPFAGFRGFGINVGYAF